MKKVLVLDTYSPTTYITQALQSMKVRKRTIMKKVLVLDVLYGREDGRQFCSSDSYKKKEVI